MDIFALFADSDHENASEGKDAKGKNEDVKKDKGKNEGKDAKKDKAKGKDKDVKKDRSSSSKVKKKKGKNEGKDSKDVKKDRGKKHKRSSSSDSSSSFRCDHDCDHRGCTNRCMCPAYHDHATAESHICQKHWDEVKAKHWDKVKAKVDDKDVKKDRGKKRKRSSSSDSSSSSAKVKKNKGKNEGKDSKDETKKGKDQDVKKDKPAETNQEKWKRLEVKWRASGELGDIVEQPDPALPFGLGCGRCIKFAKTRPSDRKNRNAGGIWVKYECGARASLTLEELKRHCQYPSDSTFHNNAVRHEKLSHVRHEELGNGEVPSSASVETLNEEVPTSAQFLANFGANMSPISNVAEKYVDHCKVARTSGDVVNFPATRSSRWGSDRCTVATSTAITHQEHEKLLSRTNPLEWATWAADGRKGVEQHLIRCVFKDFEVLEILMAMCSAESKKVAHVWPNTRT